MTAGAFDRVVTLALLAFGLWYLLTMLSYPEGAGRIPAIVATVMIAALVLQLVLSFRGAASDEGARDATASTPSTPTPTSSAQPAVDAGGSVDPRPDVVRPPDIEPDSYDTLIRLSGVRRRLFLGIAVWTLLFYVGALAVGFVATFAVLFAGLLLYVRETPFLAVAAGLVSGLAMYGFVTVFLELPAFTGFLLP